MESIYNLDLPRTRANHMSLTPLSFVARTAEVFPDKISIIHGEQKFTWWQTYQRCRQLASALVKRGIKKGETISIMAANVPAHIEVYYGVPMMGGIISGLNTRLDAPMIAFMLEHSETKLLLVDCQFVEVVTKALAMMASPPILIRIEDCSNGDKPDGRTRKFGEKDYEEFLLEGDADYQWQWPDDEWEALALNYTSGTTGDPKGVVYHHRGAYLNAVGNALAWNMPVHPVYLWTLPAFHASGWCFPWTIAAQAGTHICLRKVDPKLIFELIEKHNVSHFTGAPIVLNMLINAPAEHKKKFARIIQVMTAGSAPPAAVLEAMEKMGFNVTHVYGATEVFGPNMSCAWHEEWNALPSAERARLNARQGVRTQMLEEMIVGDSESCAELPWDGKGVGEVLMRGNVVMKGYLKNPSTNAKTFKGGWYHTGDLAVRHPDGYIEVKDRLKDIIISGGENISSIEVESVLYRHPAVLEAAVVARPDEHWGETPCAFIELKPGIKIEEKDIMSHCQENLAKYKCPKTIIFGALEKTPTGKIQKYILREKAKAL